jgi:hypothetical protein
MMIDLDTENKTVDIYPSTQWNSMLTFQNMSKDLSNSELALFISHYKQWNITSTIFKHWRTL